MTVSNRCALPFYLRVIFQLCLTAESPDESISDIFKGAAIVPKDGKVTFLTIAELILDQAILTTADEAYIMSDEHCQVHVYDAEIGPSQFQCGQFP